MIVYVTEQGSKIVKRGDLLCVVNNEAVMHTLFTHRLEQLVICGNITVTPAAMALLFRNGVDTCFLRNDGRWVGRLEMLHSRNVQLRRRQFERCSDENFRVAVSRDIVSGKLSNMATFLLRVHRSRKDGVAGEAAREIKHVLGRMTASDTLGSLRGHEGAGSRIYFETLRFAFIQDHGFRKRIRRPPTDPVNSVLSLLYTCLINRMFAAIRIAGLDPAPGVLHDMSYGRHSLPLDLVEEFRPLIADTLTVSLFNRGVLKASDFQRVHPVPEQRARDNLEAAVNDPIGSLSSLETEEFDTPAHDMPDRETVSAKLPVRLTKEAFRRVITAFEKKMETEIRHPSEGMAMTYSRAMVHQARKFRQVIEGEADRYEPLLMR